MYSLITPTTASNAIAKLAATRLCYNDTIFKKFANLSLSSIRPPGLSFKSDSMFGHQHAHIFLDVVFTDELRYALRHTTCRCGPGPEEVTKEALKTLDAEALPILLRFFN